MERITLIDYLKGFSILTIVLLHVFQGLNLPFPLDRAILFGGTGVHLFVFLSGFGLYYSHLNKPLNLTTFLSRRLGKVYFPYIQIVLISAGIFLFLPLGNNSWYALGGHLFLYKMFDESIIGSYGYQLWFVSMIIQFYLAFHALVFLRQKVQHLLWFVLVCGIISASWSAFILLNNLGQLRVWNSFFLQYLWEFALGMAFAEFFHSGKLTARPSKWAWFALGVASTAVFGFLALKGGTIGKVLNDIPALLGYGSLAVWSYLLGWKLLNRVILFIGDISYHLFLIHMLVITIVAFVLKDYPHTEILFVFLSLFFSFLLSWLWVKIAQKVAGQKRLKS